MAVFELNPKIHAAHLAPPQRIRRPAHRHPPQPVNCVQRRLDLAQMPIQLEKNILRNLLGQPAIAGHPGGERKHHRLVLVHELFKLRLPVVGHISRCYSLIRRDAELGMQRVTKSGEESSPAERSATNWLGILGSEQIRNGVERSEEHTSELQSLTN